MDNEGFNLLRAAPITAGVQAEARQQIAGPDSPVISAYDELFSDVKWSSGLQEQFGNKKSTVPAQRRNRNKAAGRKSLTATTKCRCVAGAGLQPQGPGHPNRLYFPLAGNRPSKPAAGAVPSVQLSKLVHQQDPSRYSKDFQVPNSVAGQFHMFLAPK